MSISPSDPPAVVAHYFDGHSARPHPVVLRLGEGTLQVRGETVLREEPLALLRVSEPMGAAPRLISFADGAHCEVRDHVALSGLLAAGGYADSPVVRLQARWRWALASVVVALSTFFASYVWGLPALSGWLAERVPESVLTRLGSDSLALLDRSIFAPSQTRAVRQAALREAFGRMRPPGEGGPGHQVLFRDGGRVGANAMALPNGTIVVTDQLVLLADNDEQLLAVMAHELGHVQHRHGLRMMIQGSIVAFVITWYLGDVSSVAAGLPGLLLEARYSRSHEMEADYFAAHMLESNGIPPARLAEMLEHLEISHRHSGKPATPTAAESSGAEPAKEIADYLASHPATSERVEALKGIRRQ